MADILNRSFTARISALAANLLAWLLVAACLAGGLYALSLLPWFVLLPGAVLPVLSLRRMCRCSAANSR